MWRKKTKRQKGPDAVPFVVPNPGDIYPLAEVAPLFEGELEDSVPLQVGVPPRDVRYCVGSHQT